MVIIHYQLMTLSLSLSTHDTVIIIINSWHCHYHYQLITQSVQIIEFTFSACHGCPGNDYYLSNTMSYFRLLTLDFSLAADHNPAPARWGGSRPDWRGRSLRHRTVTVTTTARPGTAAAQLTRSTARGNLWRNSAQLVTWKCMWQKALPRN